MKLKDAKECIISIGVRGKSRDYLASSGYCIAISKQNDIFEIAK